MAKQNKVKIALANLRHEVKDTINPNQTKKLYKNSSEKLYFTKEEALAFKDSVDEISISDILNSQTLIQSFVENLKHITLYDKNDLKNISKSSCMVWIDIYGFNFHLIFDKDKLIDMDVCYYYVLTALTYILGKIDVLLFLIDISFHPLLLWY